MSDFDDISDVELIRLVVAEAPGAADLFVARFARLINSVLMRRVNLSPVDADDVFQELVEHLARDNYRPLRHWSGSGDFASYLSRITYNRSLDWIRRRQSERLVPIPEHDDWSPPLAPGPTQDEVALVEHQRELVAAALAGCRVADRELYELRFAEELSYEQIASRLGITVNNVGVRINRLVARLAIVVRENRA